MHTLRYVSPGSLYCIRPACTECYTCVDIIHSYIYEMFNPVANGVYYQFENFAFSPRFIKRPHANGAECNVDVIIVLTVLNVTRTLSLA